MITTTETLFTEARTQNGYLPEPVSDDTLRQLYELMKWGPTSANSSPARLIFVRSAQARERLLACVSAGNQNKVREAPVTMIIGMDLDFHEQLPKLFPHAPDARSWFAGDEARRAETALRNSSLQGGYLILAARALGLDCGPMSGFDAAKMDAAFWPGSRVRTNFICTLGRGNPAKLFARSPRLGFDEACQLV
ncbi:MAG: malonic semialdehyde reductase [Burkholderiales bacterium]|nr:malonic semialdehyde reductase [Burkholderiales bacterium]